MEDTESLEATEIPHINRQQLPDTVDIHTRRQPGIMDLNSLNVVGDQKRAPSVVYLAAVGQKLEIPLNYSSQAVRFLDA
jgi:hypothetical protein